MAVWLILGFFLLLNAFCSYTGHVRRVHCKPSYRIVFYCCYSTDKLILL